MSSAPDTLNAVREYLRRRWAPVPLPRGSKRPVLPAWQTLRLTEADLPAHFGSGENVGLILGEPSQGLVDVDLDAPEAVSLADAFLPATGLVSGRDGKPRSHRWYASTPIPETCQYRAPNGTMLVELRSTGGQTVVPPSTHPSGEVYVWHEYGAPSPMAAEDLGRAVVRLASASLIARHWPARGSRNEAALALAGLLLRAGWEEEETVRLVCSVSGYAGDPHTDEVRATVRRLAAGGKATGGPKLAALIGEEVVARVREWLGLASHAHPTAWEVPVPLYTHPDLPAFPVRALPAWVYEYVVRLAETTQTPLDLGGALALAVLAGTVAGRAQVEVRGGWWEQLCLYMLAVLPPGEGKSPVFRALTRPLWDRERRMATQAAPAIARAEAALRLAREREAHARRQAARGKATDAEVAAAAEAAASLSVPASPRLLASDATTEALVHLLAEHGGRLIVASAEGTLIEVLAGRYSEGVPRLEAVCQAHDGDPIRVDRVGRPPEYVPHPCLTLALCIQPDVLLSMAGHREMRGRGLVARMMYAIPRSRVGTCRIDVRGMRPALAEAWAHGVEALLDTGFPPAPERRPMHSIPLAPAARERLYALHDETEPRRAPDGDLHHLADWAGKYVGRVARIACVLALADAPGIVPSAVDVAHIERAVELGSFYLTHAQAAYGLMGCDPATEQAQYVLAWLRRERRATLTRRDIMRGCRGIRRADDLDPALDLLVQHGYLREEMEARVKRGPGRPRAQRYSVHPSVVDGTDSDSADGEVSITDSDSTASVQRQKGQKGQYPEEQGADEEREGDSVLSVLFVPASLPHPLARGAWPPVAARCGGEV